MLIVRPWRRSEASSYKLQLACGHLFSVETSHHPGGVPWVPCETCGSLVEVEKVRRI